MTLEAAKVHVGKAGRVTCLIRLWPEQLELGSRVVVSRGQQYRRDVRLLSRSGRSDEVGRQLAKDKRLQQHRQGQEEEIRLF